MFSERSDGCFNCRWSFEISFSRWWLSFSAMLEWTFNFSLYLVSETTFLTCQHLIHQANFRMNLKKKMRTKKKFFQHCFPTLTLLFHFADKFRFKSRLSISCFLPWYLPAIVSFPLSTNLSAVLWNYFFLAKSFFPV